MAKQADAVEEKDNGETKSRPPTDKGARPTKILPTERTRFTKQLDLLRAFDAASVHGTKPAKLEEIEAITETRVDTVRMSVPFFTDVGFLIKSDGGYMASQDVVNYVIAYGFSQETAAEKLAPLLKSSWFMRALEPKLLFRPLTEDEAIQTLAEQATASAQYRSQIKTLLDYLTVASLIVREGNNLKLNKTALAESTRENVQVKPEIGASQPAVNAGVIPPAPDAGIIKFQINVNVDMQQLSGWEADRIKAFFAGLAQMLAANKGNEIGESSG